jgi:hypothetical protein
MKLYRLFLETGEALEEFNYGQSEKSKCTNTAAESDALRKHRVPEQQTGMEKLTKNIKSTLSVDTLKDSPQKPLKNIRSAVASFDRVNKLAKRDELLVLKPAVKTVRAAVRKVSSVEKEGKSSKDIVGTETVHRNSQIRKRDIQSCIRK